MIFLQPFILIGLPLILLPVLIHLINRRRFRRQNWAAMQFLVEATKSSVGRAKLRQFLILLFRVLAVLMLVLFLSRPLVGGWLGWAFSPAPDAVILLLDRSPSMETRMADTDQTRRERAIEALSEAASELDRQSHLVLIDSVTRAPHTLSRSEDLKSVPFAQAADAAADIPGMLQSALQWILDQNPGRVEIWLASDMQASNWKPEDPRWEEFLTELKSLPQTVRVRLLSLEQEGLFNASISIQDLIRQQRGETSRLNYVMEYQQNDIKERSFPVQAKLNNRPISIPIEADGTSMRRRGFLPLDSSSGTGWGWFELPSDANERDNRSYFVYSEPVPLKSIVVAEDPVSAALLQFAASAFSDPGQEQASLLKPHELSPETFQDISLLIWQSALPTGNQALLVEEFVQNGGVVLFLPPGQSGGNRFQGLEWSEPEIAPESTPFQVSDWEQLEGPLSDSDDGVRLPVDRLEIFRRQSILGEANVLARYSDAQPFLSRRSLDRGEYYYGTTLPNPEWSALGDGLVLIPMVQRLLEKGGTRFHDDRSVDCGRLSFTDQQRQWEPVEGPEQAHPSWAAGVYRSENRFLAVNRPAEEAELRKIDAEQLAALFQDAPVTLLLEESTRDDKLQGEIWRLFLLGMLIFLLVEAVLILPPKPNPAFASATGRQGA